MELIETLLDRSFQPSEEWKRNEREKRKGTHAKSIVPILGDACG